MASEHADGAGLASSVAKWRHQFRQWRQGRPFWGGSLLVVASLVISYVPAQYATELIFIGGTYTVIGLIFGLLVFLSGVFALGRPELSRYAGVAGVAFSILSLLGALGGLLVGMVLGIVGGNMCIAWQPPDGGD